jgi:hypothetical protein
MIFYVFLLAKFICFQQAILIKKFVAELITGLIEENKRNSILCDFSNILIDLIPNLSDYFPKSYGQK